MNNNVLFSISDKIATITFNRPDVSNAFSKETYQITRDYVERCYDDDAVGAIVFTGAGKHFSAGGDIGRFKMLIETGEYLQEDNILRAGGLAAAIRRCPKPTVAMVNGAAAGAGCSVALACDFRFVSQKSKFVMSFIKMGLPGDTGGLYHMHRLLGTAKTIELMMLGTPVGGEEAVRLGLATKLVEADTLSNETYSFAARLAGGPLAAIRRQKAMLAEFFYMDLDISVQREAQYMVECSHTEDFKEAVNAFLEKRAPIFQGK